MVDSKHPDDSHPLSGRPSEDELAALYGVSQAIGSSLDLQHVLNQVMDQIIQLTGAERSFLMLISPEDGELTFRAARNMDQETIEASSFEISRGIVQRVAQTGDPVLTTNAQVDPRFKTQDSVISYNLRSILCVPLRARGKVTGVIYADNRIRTGLFTERTRDLLITFAGQAAVTIENARLFESVSSAKALMDDVFTSVPSGVITTDGKGAISLMNRAARKILCVDGGPVVGQPFDEVLPLLARNLAPLVERVQADERPIVDVELELALADRGQVKLRVSISPLKGSADGAEGLTIVLDDLTEQRRLEARYELFQRYLSPIVIDQLPDNPDELKLGGQRQEITSLFADIRGFTDFSQQCDPEDLVEVLNCYLDVGARAVLSEEGTLDKFMGDAVVAFFNAPLPREDHVLRAVRAAVRMQEGIATLYEELPPAHRLGCGVGITVGEAIVGNVGTAQQMNYTAIGPSVNLARRLQESAGPGQTLLTRAAYRRIAEHVEARPLAPIEAEGIDEPIEVYELLALR